MLTDRGTTFGYYDLIVDMRGIPAMQNLGYPVVMDITHSLQQPNQTSGVTGGQPEMIETIARASVFLSKRIRTRPLRRATGRICWRWIDWKVFSNGWRGFGRRSTHSENSLRTECRAAALVRKMTIKTSFRTLRVRGKESNFAE